jgi:hypothetical protein
MVRLILSNCHPSVLAIQQRQVSEVVTLMLDQVEGEQHRPIVAVSAP